jgi:hypothetical protein
VTFGLAGLPAGQDARRRCAAAAAGGVVVYVLVDVGLQLLPPHYSALHEAESNLAVGRFGWIMNLNFLGRAVTTCCMVAAIRRMGPPSRLRRTGMGLFGVAAASSAALAFLPTDIAAAAGASAAGGSLAAARTGVGLVHAWTAGLGFTAALAAVAVLTPWLAGRPGLEKTRRPALAFGAVAGAGLVWLGLSSAYGIGLLGLAERLCLSGILGWAFVVCTGIRRLPAAASCVIRR